MDTGRNVAIIDLKISIVLISTYSQEFLSLVSIQISLVSRSSKKFPKKNFILLLKQLHFCSTLFNYFHKRYQNSAVKKNVLRLLIVPNRVNMFYYSQSIIGFSDSTPISKCRQSFHKTYTTLSKLYQKQSNKFLQQTSVYIVLPPTLMSSSEKTLHW